MNRPNHKRPKLEESLEQSQPDYQITRSNLHVARAVKKAKTFEVQHLVRKIKKIRDGKFVGSDSKLDPSQLPTLEAELNEIKLINPSTFARQLLSLRLVKLSHLVPLLLPPAEPLTGRAANRISSNKKLANVLTTEIASLRDSSAEALISHPSDKPSSVGTVRIKSEDVSEKRVGQSERGTMKRPLPCDSAEDGSDEDESGHEDGRISPSRSSLASKINPSKILSQSLRGKSREDIIEDTEDIPTDSNARRSDLEDDDSDSFHEGSNSGNPSGRRATASTFLPSLNVGYVCGESDGSDADDPVYDRLEREMGRKNRRGQRARRAIWEQKFGKGAKHLQKLAEKKRQRPLPPPPAITNKASGATPNPNLAPMGARKTVHPSWEAKVKQQEALAKTVPMGKKIVFD